MDSNGYEDNLQAIPVTKPAKFPAQKDGINFDDFSNKNSSFKF